ncbi:ABC transporter substrate-binding protein [Kiloniella litopenaei]|uniref:ABC transporter substrate-binding protein n=1 Tax=Kiloniella litopenaei TaxID=1549748 RepID=UPI001C3F827B|nr:ABC transporter substrate-binding protein [Kiloniella litopenaei]
MTRFSMFYTTFSRHKSFPFSGRLLRATFFLLITIFFFPAFAKASVPESKDPIRIILNNWTSQIVMAKIYGKILEAKGYEVEYKELTTKDQWARLHRGLEHVQVEVWEGTMAEDLERVRAKGQIVEVSDHDAKTREEWWYPSYVEELCPGLPDWKALKKCASLFSDSTTAPRGRYVAGPWEKPEKARIRALEMDFTVRPVKQADDLWVELEKSYQKKEPIVLFNWSPNWVEDRFEGKFIEFPNYSAECETNPAWGVNSERIHDCGNPKDGWLKKVAWVKMEQTWPCAYGVLSDMNFTNAMISKVSALVDADGMTYDQAADRWLKENHSLQNSWGQHSCGK